VHLANHKSNVTASNSKIISKIHEILRCISWTLMKRVQCVPVRLHPDRSTRVKSSTFKLNQIHVFRLLSCSSAPRVSTCAHRLLHVCVSLLNDIVRRMTRASTQTKMDTIFSPSTSAYKLSQQSQSAMLPKPALSKPRPRTLPPGQDPKATTWMLRPQQKE